MRILLVFLLVARWCEACVSVSGDQILARDFAQAIPEFRQTDPLQVIGYAPVQGTQRAFSSKEIGLWALRFHVSYEPGLDQKLCFERASRTLNLEEIQSAIRKALESPDAQVDVIDFSRSSVPPGNLEFPVTGASRSAAPIYWRGRIITGAGRNFPVWARVRVTMEVERITANQALTKGQIVAADQVSITRLPSSPFTTGFATSIDAVAGRLLKRDVAKGQPIPAAALEEPRLVVPGDVVQVEALSGQAQISFEAKAKTGGRRGDSILVQNPANGRTFQAAIIDKGKVQCDSHK